VGLLGEGGKQLPLTLDGENDAGPLSRVLDVKEPEQSFTFTGVAERPVPSLLRGFSAPVTLDAGYSRDDLAFLLETDPDSFSRWEAGQTLATGLMLDLVAAYRRGETLALDGTFLEAFESVLTSDRLDPSLIALTIGLPSQAYLAQQMAEIDVEAIEAVHRFVRGELSTRLRGRFRAVYDRHNDRKPYVFTPAAVGDRSLKNAALAYLMAQPTDDIIALCRDEFFRADNMTDSLAALNALANTDTPARQEAIDAFYARWSNNPLVVDKWLSVQALSDLPDTLERVRALMGHEAFSMRNPNKVRALIGAFTQSNQPRFHDADGGGYKLLADVVLELDTMNPQVASRMTGGFNQWRRFDKTRQAMMRAEIDRILRQPGLSKDVYEIASKSVAGA
jgi:aminopeptidase N